MSMRLRWLASEMASALHAAAAVADQQTLVDPALEAELAQPVAALQEELYEAAVPEPRFFRMLCALATTFDNHRQLAKMALYRTLLKAPPEDLVVRLAGRIADIVAVVRRAQPGLAEELSLRSGPLREQWEARGPGMLARIFDLTEGRLMVEAADVVLVQPVLGGGGAAQLQNNSVRIEAVLAHPHPRLPETVRLAWLLAQLHLDLPHFAEEMAPERLPQIAALAMLPAALAAGEYVELVELNDDIVRYALDAWQLATPPDLDAVDVLLRWWDAYQQSRPPFEVAFKALDRMMVAT